MIQGIIIIHWSEHQEALKELMASLEGYNEYPIYIVTNSSEHNEWEMAAFHFAKRLELDEFFILQDTMIVKNKDLFRIAFEDYKGKSVNFANDFWSYLGKYRLEIINKMIIPEIANKSEAVIQESLFNSKYMQLETNCVELCHGYWQQPDKHVFKHGRDNLYYENEYIIKYKGTWSPHMIPTWKEDCDVFHTKMEASK